MSVEFKPEWVGQPLHGLPDGASGCKSRTAEQALNEMVDGGVIISEGSSILSRVPDMFGFPDACNSTDHIEILDQKQKGACAGFTMAQVASINFWIASGGDTRPFSGDAMYVLAQEKDGIRGDRGSTPTACAWVVQNIGVVPLESYGPTVETYRELRPVTDEHRAAAEPYKMQSIVRLRSFSDMWKFQTAGLGAIQVCSLWKEHFMAKEIRTFHGAKHNSQHGGGHSWTVGGYNKSLMALLGLNSWNVNVHDEGAFLAMKRFWEELFGNNMSLVLGYSNMSFKGTAPVDPRPFPVKSRDFF